MDSLPSRALPSGTPTHRKPPTLVSSAWLPIRALPSPSLFLSHSTPNFYVSDYRQQGDHGPEQLASFGTVTFSFFFFPFGVNRRLEFSLASPFLGNCDHLRPRARLIFLLPPDPGLAGGCPGQSDPRDPPSVHPACSALNVHLSACPLPHLPTPLELPTPWHQRW